MIHPGSSTHPSAADTDSDCIPCRCPGTHRRLRYNLLTCSRCMNHRQDSTHPSAADTGSAYRMNRHPDTRRPDSSNPNRFRLCTHRWRSSTHRSAADMGLVNMTCCRPGTHRSAHHSCQPSEPYRIHPGSSMHLPAAGNSPNHRTRRCPERDHSVPHSRSR